MHNLFQLLTVCFLEDCSKIKMDCSHSVLWNSRPDPSLGFVTSLSGDLLLYTIAIYLQITPDNMLPFQRIAAVSSFSVYIPEVFPHRLLRLLRPSSPLPPLAAGECVPCLLIPLKTTE